MKRRVWIGVLVVLAVVAAFVAAYVVTVRQKKETTPRQGIARSDYAIKEIDHKETAIYSEQFQKEADDQISQWKQKNDYSVESPLLVWNPYGTNTGSVYYYGQSSKESYVRCKIITEQGSIIENRLKNSGDNGLTRQHEYLITGLAPGQLNQIVLSFFDRSDQLLWTGKYQIGLEKDSEIPDITSVEKGNSKEALSEGLFAVLGHDKSKAANIYYFDNAGISRGKTPLEDYRTDRILTIEGNLVYSYSLSDIAVVNRLGRVEKTVNLGKYELHHDFMYDKDKKVVLCLVNDENKDTIEDVLISVSLETGKVRKLVDFETLLQDMRNRSVQRKGGKNTYGGTELDWLHLNSMDLLNDKDAVFSSREESVIIKVKNIYDKPSIDYMIHKGSLYQGTQYEKYLLKPKGDTVGPAGQHTITVERSKNLKNHQYYLFFYDNNFGSAKTLPSFDWSLYPGVGSYRKGTASYFTKFLVDEKKRTYQMIQHFSVPYSSVVSGVNYYKGNITFSSGMAHSYGEYDREGNMICTYKYEARRYAYRVIKYDFKDVFYN